MFSTAGAAESVEGLVLVAHHAQVAVGLGQLREQTLLDVAGVLVFVAQQVHYPVRDLSGDLLVVLQEFHQPPLQVAEIGRALIKQQVLVAPVGSAQRGGETPARVDEFPGVDEFVADAVEVLGRIAHHGIGPPPSPSFQPAQVGTEDLTRGGAPAGPSSRLRSGPGTGHARPMRLPRRLSCWAQNPCSVVMRTCDASPS